MPAIMADHDVEGQVQVLLHLLTSAEWHPLWLGLEVRVESFATLGIPIDIADSELWQACHSSTDCAHHRQSEPTRTGVSRGSYPHLQHLPEPASVYHR
jgi:hypothetical protein